MHDLGQLPQCQHKSEYSVFFVNRITLSKSHFLIKPTSNCTIFLTALLPLLHQTCERSSVETLPIQLPLIQEIFTSFSGRPQQRIVFLSVQEATPEVHGRACAQLRGNTVKYAKPMQDCNHGNHNATCTTQKASTTCGKEQLGYANVKCIARLL